MAKRRSEILGLVAGVVATVAAVGTMSAFELAEPRPADGQMRGAVVGTQHNPDVAWNGEFYLVVWEDDRDDEGDIFAARVSSNGMVLDPDGFPIAVKPGEQRHPAIASCPSSGDFLVVWEEAGAGVAYNRLDPTATPIDGQGIELAATGDDVEVAASRTGYGIVWVSGATLREQALLGCEFENGQPGPIVTIASSRADEPAIESDGDRFLVLWSSLGSDADDGDIYSQTMDDSVLGTSHRLGSGRGARPRPKAAFSNGRYLVTWPDEIQRDVFTLRCTSVEADGRPVGIPVGLPGVQLDGRSYAGAVAAAGTGYFISWGDSTDDPGTMAPPQLAIHGMRCDSTADGLLQFSPEIALSNGSSTRADPELCEGPDPSELLLVWEEEFGVGPNGQDEDVSGQLIQVSTGGAHPLGEALAISGAVSQAPIQELVAAGSRDRSRSAVAWLVQESALAPQIAAGIYLAELKGGSDSPLMHPLLLGSSASRPSLALSENAIACAFLSPGGTATCWISTSGGASIRHQFPNRLRAGSQVSVAIDPDAETIVAFAEDSAVGDADVQVIFIQAGNPAGEFGQLSLPLSGDQINPLVACTLGLVFVFFEQLDAAGESHDLVLVRLQENPLASGGFAQLDPRPLLIAKGISAGKSTATAGAREVMLSFQIGGRLIAESVTETGALTSPNGSGHHIRHTGSAIPSRLMPFTDGVNFTFFWDEQDPDSGLHAHFVTRMASPASGAYTPGTPVGPKQLRGRSPITLAGVIPGASGWTLLNAQPAGDQVLNLESLQAVSPTAARLFPSINSQRRYFQIRGHSNSSYRLQVSSDLTNWSTLAELVTDYRGLNFWREPDVPGSADQFFRLDQAFWP